MEGFHYRFFWGGVEFQLAAYEGENMEELINIYTTALAPSLVSATRDMRADMRDRKLHRATLDVQTDVSE